MNRYQKLVKSTPKRKMKTIDICSLCAFIFPISSSLISCSYLNQVNGGRCSNKYCLGCLLKLLNTKLPNSSSALTSTSLNSSPINHLQKQTRRQQQNKRTKRNNKKKKKASEWKNKRKFLQVCSSFFVMKSTILLIF